MRGAPVTTVGTAEHDSALLQKVLELAFRQWAAADGRDFVALTHLLNSNAALSLRALRGTK